MFLGFDLPALGAHLFGNCVIDLPRNFALELVPLRLDLLMLLVAQMHLLLMQPMRLLYLLSLLLGLFLLSNLFELSFSIFGSLRSGIFLKLLGLFGLLLSFSITRLLRDPLSLLRSLDDLFTVFMRTFLLQLDLFFHLPELLNLGSGAFFDLVDCLLRVEASQIVELS